jgi:hypothetical protein
MWAIVAVPVAVAACVQWRMRSLAIVAVVAVARVAAADALPTVDAGVRWISSCGGVRIAVRAPSDVWMLDRCGDWYSSGDRGRHWERADVLSHPLPDDAATGLGVHAFDAHDSIALEDGGLVYRHDGQVVLATSVLVSPPTGAVEQLAGIVQAPGVYTRWAWSAAHVFASIDGGTSWFVVSDAPQPVARMVLADAGTALLRVRSGALFRAGYGWFTEWQPTADAMDERAWAQQTGMSAPSPLACVAASTTGDLKVEVTAIGCYHYWHSEYSTRWNARGASVRTDVRDARNRVTPRFEHVTAARGKSLVPSLAAVMMAPEPPPTCLSTSKLVVDVEWSCDGGRAQHASFGASACGGSDTGASRGIPGPSRADALWRIVRDASR